MDRNLKEASEKELVSPEQNKKEQWSQELEDLKFQHRERLREPTYTSNDSTSVNIFEISAVAFHLNLKN
jgi:hypothetical protein